MKNQTAHRAAPPLLGLALMLATSASHADDAPPQPPTEAARTTGSPPSPPPDYLSLGAGYVGVLRDAVGGSFSLEYRWHENWHGIHPAVLLGATSHASYINISLLYPVRVGSRWLVTISSGPGSYSRDDEGQNLGSPLEFLSSIELARLLPHGRQLALGFAHISNANLGHPQGNPGNETLRLSWTMPISRP